MDSEKGKEPAFRYRSREGRTHGEPSVSSRFPIPGTSGGDTKSWKSGPGREVTGPEEYKRRFLVPAPKSVEWKTAYIDGRLHRRIAMLVRAAGCGSISGFIIRLLELHMEEHREDIAALLGEVYRPWDEDGQPGEPARR